MTNDPAAYLPAPDEMDEWEQKILMLLCDKGRYHSSVALSADLYGASEEVQEERVLEWNLVELILQDLNLRNLVTYRLGAFNLFVHLRPTREAYAYMKRQFPTWIHEVGQSRHGRYELPIRSPEDRTDFRTHGRQAVVVEPAVKEDFIEHCAACDHLNKHLSQLRELYGTDKL